MVFEFGKLIINPLVKPWIGKIRGLDVVPEKKGAILAANHASYLDHFIIGITIISRADKHVHYLAKQEHFNTFISRLWHKHYLKAIPVDRTGGGKEALKWAIHALKEDKLIMIYPEGTRTLTGKMSEAKTGVARLALAAKVPIIPIGVTNTFKIMPKGQHWPSKGKADINFGKPMYFKEYYGRDDDHDVLRKITTKVMKEIAKLAHTEYPY